MEVEKKIENVVEDNFKLGGNMKKISKVLMISVLIIVTGCSSLTGLFKSGPKDVFTKEQVKNWEKTLEENLVKNALIPEWYAEANPLVYLRQTGVMTEKEVNFLTSLNKTIGEKEKNITAEDIEKFTDIAKKYNKKLRRKFYLKDENIKDGLALTKKMVVESYLKMETPSSHISKEVATPKEWEKIVSFSKKSDLTEKEITELRKILNKFIKRNEIFNEKLWYTREVSPRVLNIVKISKQKSKSSLEQNNLNAKALYIIYSKYFSEMYKWDN